MKRALIIINPKARGVLDAQQVGLRALAALAEGRVAAEAVLAGEGEEATRLAQEAVGREYDMVFAAGGDGTANRVVDGLAGSGVAFGFLPLGTSNSLAHYLGLAPGQIERSCRALLGGGIRCLDLGVINGRHFIDMAGIGLDAVVAKRTSERLKARLGVYSFLANFPGALRESRPWEHELTVDGQRSTGRMWSMFVCNTPRYVWRIPVKIESSERDGLLEILVLRECSRARLVAIAAEIFLLRKAPAAVPEIELIRGSEFELHTDPPAVWELDGELGGPGVVQGRVEAGALNLVVPRGSRAATTESCSRNLATAGEPVPG